MKENLLRNTQNNCHFVAVFMVGKSIILVLMLKSGMREGLQWKGCPLLLIKNPVETLICR